MKHAELYKRFFPALLLCPSLALGAFADGLVGLYEIDQGTGTSITADAGSNGTAISGQLVADLGDGLPGLDLGAAAGDATLGDVDQTTAATWCFYIRPFVLANNTGFLDRYFTTGNRRAWRLFVQADGDIGGAFSSDGTANDSFGTTAAGIVANDTTTWLCVTYDAGAIAVYKDANMSTAIFTDTLTQTSLLDDDLDVLIGAHSLTNADVGLRRLVMWDRVATASEMNCARDNGAACIALSPAPIISSAPKSFIIPHGDTAPKIAVALVDARDGTFLSGLTFETMDLVISCGADTAATRTNYAATTDIETITTIGTYADPGEGDIAFREVESEGIYEIHLDDALVATANARYVYCDISGAANLVPREIVIFLDVIDGAGIQAAAVAALIAEDVPSNTDLNARSLAAAAYATEANQQTILDSQSDVADGTTKVSVNLEGALTCEVNTANFAGSTTSFACILTDLAGDPVTKASGDLSGKAILVLSGAQIDEGRYIGENATTWDAANSELQITVQRPLPGTLADAVIVRIH